MKLVSYSQVPYGNTYSVDWMGTSVCMCRIWYCEFIPWLYTAAFLLNLARSTGRMNNQVKQSFWLLVTALWLKIDIGIAWLAVPIVLFLVYRRKQPPLVLIKSIRFISQNQKLFFEQPKMWKQTIQTCSTAALVCLAIFAVPVVVHGSSQQARFLGGGDEEVGVSALPIWPVYRSSSNWILVLEV